MSTLERQLTSPGMPGPSRHVSGDQGITFRGQDPRRHLSGDQVQVSQVRVRCHQLDDDDHVTCYMLQVLSAGGQGRRPSGDTGVTRFVSGEQTGHFSLEQGPGNGHQAIIRTQPGPQPQVQR